MTARCVEASGPEMTVMDALFSDTGRNGHGAKFLSWLLKWLLKSAPDSIAAPRTWV